MKKVLAVTFAFGCTQDFNVFLGDAASDSGSGSDSAADSAADAARDSGLATCDAGITCVYCATTGTATTTACQTFHQTCSGGAPPGFTGCPCSSATSCPSADNVCRNNTCRPCGDST